MSRLKGLQVFFAEHFWKALVGLILIWRFLQSLFHWHLTPIIFPWAQPLGRRWVLEREVRRLDPSQGLDAGYSVTTAPWSLVDKAKLLLLYAPTLGFILIFVCVVIPSLPDAFTFKSKGVEQDFR